MCQLTDRVLVAVVLVLSLYDLAVLATAGSESTISRRVLLWSQQFPLIPFAAGVLIGHLFCSQTIRGDP
jgi:hypothetical protein